MFVAIQYDQDVALVSMKGKLMGGPETRLCDQTLQNLIKEGVRKITIDMSGVIWLNSGGMGMLMAAYNRLRKEGGILCLSGTTPGTRRLLTLTKLNTLFRCYDTAEQAVSSLHSGSGVAKIV